MTEQEQRVLMSAQDALSILYFADSSDYKAALHRILMRLDPEMYKRFLRDEGGAFDEMNKKVVESKVDDTKFYISLDDI